MIDIQYCNASEKRGAVTSDLMVGSYDIKVCVLLCSSFIVVSCADMGDVAYFVTLFQSDGNDLRVYLQVFNTIEDSASCFL